jgi:hypothetical protein
VSASEPEPQVSWKVLEQNSAVVTADGAEAARVVEVSGDVDRDIFSGLVVRSGPLGTRRFVAADRVVAIWRQRVEVDLTAEEVEALPQPQEPELDRLTSGAGLLERLRRLLSGARGGPS